MMLRFIVRRLVMGALALVGAMLIMFVLSRAKGDPRYILLDMEGPTYGMTQERWDALGRELGLDKHVVVQFGIWLADAFRFDFGDSLLHQRPVRSLVRTRFMATLQLGAVAWVMGTIVGIPLGVFSALNRGKLVDIVARSFAVVGQAAPAFWTGIMLIFFFSVFLGWLPVATMGDGFSPRHYILPAVTLAWMPAASYLRFTRTAMLEVLESEYVRLARAKGVSQFSVVWNHAFRNALIVPLTFSGLLLVGFITGSVIVETVFAWPGLGLLTIQSLWSNDFPALSAVIYFYGILYILMVMLLDISYALIDPRIRYT